MNLRRLHGLTTQDNDKRGEHHLFSLGEIALPLTKNCPLLQELDLVIGGYDPRLT